MSTTENEELVSRVYTQALQDRDDGRELAAADLMVYHIEMLSQEVNSGASFEQYFRWASVEQISEAAARLESLALSDVAKIVRRAIDVAFPNGLPATDEEKSDLTEWTEEQEELLSTAANEFEEFNGRIINVLAAFYRKSKPGA
ncbi:MAG: DMP19 family protein [Betaproteobacteria bacterium]|nr:DMP19 family protein [Betaproteobacteria bacterium]